MKIINRLAFNYLKKNKKRSTATIFRNYYCNITYYYCSCTSFKLSAVYDKYC